MVPLLLLASIPTMSLAALEAAPDAQDQAVRQSRNGEFMIKHYPPAALARGEQGRVAFRLTIEPDGSLGTCDVTESSGFATLDKETCEILLRYARLKPVFAQDGRRIRATQSGFIVWTLPARANRVASTTAKTMTKPDQIICKRSQTTGSLIQKTKQCMTRAEWVRTERMYQDEMDHFQGKAHFDQNSEDSGG